MPNLSMRLVMVRLHLFAVTVVILIFMIGNYFVGFILNRKKLIMLSIRTEIPVAKRLSNIIDVLGDLREYFEDVAVPEASSHFSELWGSMGFGEWPTPLYKTGRLYRSFVRSGSADNVKIVTNRSLEYGSNVLYAKYHRDKIIGVVINKDLLRRRYQKSLRNYILKKARN